MKTKISFRTIRNQLEPGNIYLTIGTGQQVTRLSGGLVKHTQRHYNPTVQQFRRLLIPTPLYGPSADVIFYPRLEGTGRIRNGPKTYGTLKPTSTEELIPNDQTVVVPRSKFIFVVLADPITGEIDKSALAKAKSLEGGCFKLLDLRTVDFEVGLLGVPGETEWLNKFPMTALEHAVLLQEDNRFYLPYLAQQWNNATEEHQPYDKETAAVIRLFESLPTEDGVNQWYHFPECHNYFKWFLVYVDGNKEGQAIPIALKTGRAWGLALYLEPFLDQMRDNLTLAPLMLSRFALWVWSCNHVYAEPGYEGFYQTTGFKAKAPYWNFKPSVKARQAFAKIIESLSY
jgi:hypothetical protein